MTSPVVLGMSNKLTSMSADYFAGVAGKPSIFEYPPVAMFIRRARFS